MATMVNELYDPFFQATRDVFQLMLDLSNISEQPLPTEEVTDPNGRLNIAIDIVGDLQGKVVYRFPKQTSLEMVKIMCSMEISEIDDFVTSAMGEVANIISGNVLSTLSNQKINCDILPPQIIMKDIENTENIDFKLHSGMQICTDIGNIDLDIMLNTTSNKQ